MNRHDIGVIQVYDPRERSLPAVGLIHAKDSESGAASWINTDSPRVRLAYAKWFSDMNTSMCKLLNRYQIDSVSISTDEDYAKGLMTFFKKR